MTTFADAAAIEADGPDRFRARLDPDWTIGGKPNGGYLLAVMTRAATATGPHGHVLAASAHYLRAPEPGAVTIDVEPLRAGRSASQFHVRLSQDDTRCVEALVTTGTLREAVTPRWDAGVPDAPTAPFDDCIRLGSRAPGFSVVLMDQIEVRLDPDTAGFTRGAPAGRGELRGWVRLPEEEPFDPSSLVFAADVFPPASFDIAPSGWVPTLELTVYVRALPRQGPSGPASGRS
jgi:hypothetical protein